MSEQKQKKAKKGAKYPDETIEKAKFMWLDGLSPSVIANELNINNLRIIYVWRDKFKWHKLKAPESVLLNTSRLFNIIMERDDKTAKDWYELDKMADLMLKLEKVEAFKRGEWVGSGRSFGSKNGKRKKQQKRKKNDVSDLTKEMFDTIFDDLLYQHQKIWIAAGENNETKRVRFILKSRQIGATFTFALEAFCTAVLKGHNQIFISSTRKQAEVFKSFISMIAKEHFDVEIAGDPVKLFGGPCGDAELHFLSPNSFADSRSGDVYFDECFKTYKFQKMEDIASPMATLSKFKKTYFSSPTAKSHEAYEIWDGTRFTKHHKDVEIDVSDHANLVEGRKFDDGIWRCVCTVHDAIAMGWDLVDLEQLHREMPDPDLFAVTYECAFIDDADSIFKLDEILACGVDTATWTDFDPLDDRPFGLKPVTTGYDPAGISDNASFEILSKPASRYEKFRLLDGFSFKGIRAPAQCSRIERYNECYNIEYMEIDSTGPGIFVGDFVEEIFPQVNRITYNPEYKARMVQKAQSVIQAKRFEYDENDTELPLSFLTVYMKTTESGVITYGSRHSKDVGHGDKAWAIMHAMMCEKFNPDARRNFSCAVYH
jgi:uncharacterized protein YjcR